jgi:hypothetical protein
MPVANIKLKSNTIIILIFNNLTRAISLIHFVRLITNPPSSPRDAVKAGLWNFMSLEYCIAEYGESPTAVLHNGDLKIIDLTQLTQKC